MTSRYAIILYGRSDFIRWQALASLIDSLAAEIPGALAATGIRRFCILPCGVPAHRSISRWLPGALSAHCQLAGVDMDIRIASPVEDFLDFGAADRGMAAKSGSMLATVAGKRVQGHFPPPPACAGFANEGPDS